MKYILKKINIICIFLFAHFIAFAYTERNLLEKTADKQILKEFLLSDQSWVYFPNYNNRSAWNNLFGKTKEAYIKAGNNCLNYNWKVIKATDYMEFEKSGNRAIMQNPYWENIYTIMTLMMAELAEGKGRFIPQLINGVFYACEMSSWTLSAHLASEQLSKRALPEYQDVVIEHQSAETGALMSWIYYFFHKEFDKYNPEISKRLYHEIYKRIINPFREIDRYWWMALNYEPGWVVNNHNTWVNFSVLQCLLLMENDKEKLVNDIYKSITSIDKYMNYVSEDGGCEEGPSYWKLGPGKLFEYLDLLKVATQGKVSIFDQAMIKRMGEFVVRSYVGNGYTVNFADASPLFDSEYILIYRYGQAIKDSMMINFAAYLDQKDKRTEEEGKYVRISTDISNALHALIVKNEIKKINPTLERIPYSWYPETQFCFMTNENGFFVATKGGFNDESHNHNDIGTISVYLHSIPILIDAGVEEYTRQTFGPERYSIWTMQSQYHNLPTINGYMQEYGREFKAKNVSFDNKKMKFTLDLSQAYPKEAQIKKWIRSCTVEKKDLIVRDEFELKQTLVPNQINFLTWGEVNISKPGIINISTKGENVSIQYEAKKFNVEIENKPINDSRLLPCWGNMIYRIILTSKNKNVKDSYSYIIKPM